MGFLSRGNFQAGKMIHRYFFAITSIFVITLATVAAGSPKVILAVRLITFAVYHSVLSELRDENKCPWCSS